MSERKEELFAKLREITASWNIHDDVAKGEQLRCRVIGKRLDNMGGTALMREAYYDAKSANPAVTVLQAFWDGIGDWRW